VVSAVSIVGCIVLAVWPVRRRRRRHRHGRRGDDGSTAETSTAAPDGVTDSISRDELVLDRRPTIRVPFGSEGPRAGLVATAVTAVLAGLVAAAVAQPRAGLAVGLATVVVLLVPRLRVVLGLLAMGCIVAAATYVIVHQSQLQVPDNGAWPQSFGVASEWAWAGVVFLGADGAVDVVLRAGRRRTARRSGEPVVDDDLGSSGPLDDPLAGSTPTV